VEVVDEGDVVVEVAWRRQWEYALSLELLLDLAALLEDDEALEVRDVEDDTVMVGTGKTVNGGMLSVVADQHHCPFALYYCHQVFPSCHGPRLTPVAYC